MYVKVPPFTLTFMIFYSFFSLLVILHKLFIISYGSHYICIWDPSGYLLFGAHTKVSPFTFNFYFFFILFSLLVTLHKLFNNFIWFSLYLYFGFALLIIDFYYVGGMGGPNMKTEPSFFGKITFWKNVNSQQKKDLLSNFFSMHPFFVNEGRPKSALADLLSTLSTQN